MNRSEEEISIKIAKKDCDRFLMLLKLGLEVSLKQNWNKQKVPRRISDDVFRQLVGFSKNIDSKKRNEITFSKEFQDELLKVLDHFEERSLIERATQQFSKRAALMNNYRRNLSVKELDKLSHEFADEFYFEISQNGLLNFHRITSEEDAKKALKWIKMFDLMKDS